MQEDLQSRIGPKKLLRNYLRAICNGAKPPHMVVLTLLSRRDEGGRIALFATVSQRLASIPGIGPIIATGIATTVADPTVFRSGRRLGWAWCRGRIQPEGEPGWAASPTGNRSPACSGKRS